jgi:RNA polymerase sigma-70 factor (ECF subfamily)
MRGDEEDIALVRRFKNGDETAFDRLFEKYKVPLYSICYRFTRNEADARDLTQDIFIKLYANLKKFHEKSKLFTWLYRICVNTCISFKRKAQTRHLDYHQHQETIPMDKRIQMKIAIDDALVQLPERQRMSFILHHYDGYTFDEIGNIMGISTGAAKANHYHAMRKLQILLKDYV